MANRLEKSIRLRQVSPGTAGAPAVAAVPYRPAITLYRTVTTTQTYPAALPLVYVPPNPLDVSTVGRWVYSPGTGASILTDSQGNPIYTTRTTSQVVASVIPEQAAVAAQPAVSPTPAEWAADYALGWNAGGYSAATYVGDVAVAFTAPESRVGIVCGLSDSNANKGVGRNEIQFAWQITHDTAQPVESGTLKSTAQAVTAATVYKVERTGSTIKYYLDGTLKYTSLIASTAFSLVVDASLYSGGDAIVDATITGGVTTSATPPTTTATVIGSDSPDTGIVIGDGAVFAFVVARDRPDTGYGDDVADYVPAFAAVFGADSPDVGYVIDLAGTVGTVSASDKPDIGFAVGDGAAFAVVYASDAPDTGGVVSGAIVRIWPDVVNLSGTIGRVSFTLSPGCLPWSLQGTISRPYMSANAFTPQPWVIQGTISTPYMSADAFRRSPWPSQILLPATKPKASSSLGWWLPGTHGVVSMHSPAPSASYAYCYHLDNGMAATRFTNFNFFAVLRIEGANYGVKSNGLHKIGGETDAGVKIASAFRTPAQLFGVSQLKHCPWLHYEGDHGALVTVRVGRDDAPAVGPYTGTQRRNNQGRAQLGGGLLGGAWSFRFENVKGQALRIMWVEPDFKVTGRRV